MTKNSIYIIIISFFVTHSTFSMKNVDWHLELTNLAHEHGISNTDEFFTNHLVPAMRDMSQAKCNLQAALEYQESHIPIDLYNKPIYILPSNIDPNNSSFNNNQIPEDIEEEYFSGSEKNVSQYLNNNVEEEVSQKVTLPLQSIPKLPLRSINEIKELFSSTQDQEQRNNKLRDYLWQHSVKYNKSSKRFSCLFNEDHGKRCGVSYKSKSHLVDKHQLNDHFGIIHLQKCKNKKRKLNSF